jgi:hypothetical protein
MEKLEAAKAFRLEGNIDDYIESDSKTFKEIIAFEIRSGIRRLICIRRYVPVHSELFWSL